MNDIFNSIGKVVTALGGASAIIIACSSFLSKLWADLFMKRKTIEYDKQIENLKNTLSLEVEKYKALNEQVIYKNKVIFEMEFDIYKEIIPLLIKMKESVKQCYINLINKQDYDNEKAIDISSEFYDTLLKYAAFIDEELYESLINHHSFCMNELMDSQDKTYEQIKKIWMKNIMDLDIETNKLLNSIRQYLRNISTLRNPM